ncbi:MAG: hypothetical protein DRQ44_12095 [Gammaproteobacteria bacterium]|nr:MAG: hypothetical protein DRQ44_12095 [Gammaproteobacteria bacterium]
MNIQSIQKIILILLAVSSNNLHAGGCNSGSGEVIVDNTATASVVAIGANLGFRCDDRGGTAIDDGYGGNAINISDFKVIQRVSDSDSDELQVFIGKSSSTVSEFNYGTDNQYDLFAEGRHLFDLERLRTAADWISANVTPDAGVPAGSYGTISLDDFLANIAAGRTMYGMVRVKIPLQAGESNSTLNALNETVTAGSIYGFCDNSDDLCSCSPGNSFDKLEEGKTICGHSFPDDAKIKVKGGLFWDFVDSVDGRPLELAELPFVPRELYFKVETPVMVNWAHDLDEDGAMDNMELAKAYSDGYSDADIIDKTFNYSDVPQESKDQYNFENGTALTEALFDALDDATKYHMMLPSGYADGWAEAFDKLNITAADWSTIPGMTKPFRIPSDASGVITVNVIRSGDFEDIPTYLYSGGLIDMHDHVNVSGLVYVPQGMELEAKGTGITKQYISGAIIIRDSFYIEAKDGTVTVISSDPLSYASVRRALPAATANGFTEANLSFSNSIYAGADDASGDSSSSSSTSTSSGGASGTSTPGNVSWQEVRPQL